MSKAKKSYVLDHFIDKGKGVASCKICLKDIIRSHSGTSSMSSHLRSQHQIEDPNKQQSSVSSPNPEANNASTSAVIREPAPKRRLPQGGQLITKFMRVKSLEEILPNAQEKIDSRWIGSASLRHSRNSFTRKVM